MPEPADLGVDVDRPITLGECDPTLRLASLGGVEDRDGLGDGLGLHLGLLCGDRGAAEPHQRNTDQRTNRQAGRTLLDRHVISPLG